MARCNRRQAETAALLGVLLAADPEQADVEHPHRTGEHPTLGSTPRRSVLGDTRAAAGQRIRELDHLAELLAVTLLPPAEW